MGPKAFAGNPSAGRPPGPPPPVSYESFWMLSKAHPIALYPLKGRPSCERPRTHPVCVCGSTRLAIVVVSGKCCLPAAGPLLRFNCFRDLNLNSLGPSRNSFGPPIALSVVIATPPSPRITRPFLRRPPITQGCPIEWHRFHRSVVGVREFEFMIAGNDNDFESVISKSPLRPFAAFPQCQLASFSCWRMSQPAVPTSCLGG
jgi:hypothetical protein